MENNHPFEIKEIKFTNDSGLLETSDKIYIPSLKTDLDIWIDSENNNQKTFTKKQLKVFNDFSQIDFSEILNKTKLLENCFLELQNQGHILKSIKNNSLKFELLFKTIILPQQNKTSDNFLFILADTNWKIKYSEFTIELEILIKNNQLYLIQEYAGLWTRLEWQYEFNVD